MNIKIKRGFMQGARVMLALFVFVGNMGAAESEEPEKNEFLSLPIGLISHEQYSTLHNVLNEQLDAMPCVVTPLSKISIEQLFENVVRLSDSVFTIEGKEYLFVEAAVPASGIHEEVAIPVIQIAVAQQQGLTCGPCAMVIAGSIIATELHPYVTKNECQLDGKLLGDWGYVSRIIDDMNKKGINTCYSEAADLFLWWNFFGGAPILCDGMIPHITTIDSSGESMHAPHCPQEKESLKDVVIPRLWNQLNSTKPYAMVFLINTGDNGEGSHWFPLVVIQYNGGARSYFVADSLGNRKRIGKDCPIGHGKTVTLLHVIQNIEESIVLLYKKQETT